MNRDPLASMLRSSLTMILAGGQGERLYPLTRDRTKPAVPFGGIYRIIDFTLSNWLNSNLRKIYILTQYKSDSLHTHLRLGWGIFHEELGEYIVSTPPQFRASNHWYKGTADAIFQNIYTLQEERPEYVIILAGDHIIHTHRVFTYPFQDAEQRQQYGRDVGTIDSFWEANMDVISIVPSFNLYDAAWPIRTYQAPSPPAKTVLRINRTIGSASHSNR